MKAKVGITLAVAALALCITQTASANQAMRRAICGPNVSLMLWPHGYEAHPQPSFEIFRGLNGPYGLANRLGTQAATSNTTRASVLDSSCADYPGTAGPTHAMLGSTATGATRLACSFPRPPVVITDPRAQGAMRIRLVLPSGALVAQATITRHGSTLAYASRYCATRHPLITPAS